MPANLTPQYHKAEEWFRSAGTTDEKILALEEMLRIIPKHKGTDHLCGELRRKMSKLKDSATQKGKAGLVDIFYVPRSGAGQVAMIGTPNCGKSSIVGALTNAKVHITDFPFATNGPVPGMMKYEGVQIELVDMPPITAEYSAAGQVGTYRNCDIIAIVIDVSSDYKEQMEVCFEFLESRRLLIGDEVSESDEHGNVLGKKTICICTKCDLAEKGIAEKVKGLCGHDIEFFELSVNDKEDLEGLAERLFCGLSIIRVYTKPPGKKMDMTEPFTLPAGSTVMDLAMTVHRKLAEKLKYARIWGTGVHPGQKVQRTHVLNDKDVIELHFS